jgi:ADP-dependent NAD(P)H-hydrate dehydratase / NAD(P)H-hydrate epimerase
MREWETASWAAGRNEQAVIAQAGQRVAERVQRMTRGGGHILLLAGKGHNGDDARQALPHLNERKFQLLSVNHPAESHSALCEALEKRPALVVDGLFGIGLNRPLDEAWCRFIGVVNDSGVPVLAIDTPSGLDADTGLPQGAAVRAVLTLTMGAPKRGLLAAGATEFVGRLEVAPEIGLIPCPFNSGLQWTVPSDFAGYPPQRSPATHKGSYGHLAIVAGSLGYHGAAVLAAQGALRAQPGLVTVYPQPDVYVPVASQLAQAMVHPWRAGQSLPEKCAALLVGPGLAADGLPGELKTQLQRWWRELPLPMVVDASALDWPPDGPVQAGGARVITPHPGEAARLLETTTAAVQADRVGALRELSRKYGGCVVVLKGHQTLVGQASGDVFINSSGNPHLAQGGSGDVLAGLLAGLLAQPALAADALNAARFAVWLHGAAADELQAAGGGWGVADLLQQLARERP